MMSSSRLSCLLLALCSLWGGPGCSSESLASDDAAGGSGATGGGGGASSADDLPDYATSGCYGEPRNTSIYNGDTHELSELAAICRGESERVRVYVADALFDGGISQDEVNGFIHRLELIGQASSYRPDLGVLPTNEDVFGALDPALLAGDKLPIFVFDTQGAGDGYLCSWCSGAELHLDGSILDPLNGDLALSIAAHEAFHAIHRGFDGNEDMWVDESLAEAAMSVNGFFTDRAALNDFAARPNVNWGPAREDIRDYHYGAGLAFGTWLWEFGGEELMRRATAAPENGWAGIDAALSGAGHSQTGLDAFLEMAAALYLDDVERGYGFRSFDLVTQVRAEALDDGATASGTLQPFGLVYYRVSAGVRALQVSALSSVHARLLAHAQAVELLPIEVNAAIEVEEGQVLILTSAGAAPVPYSVSAQ